MNNETWKQINGYPDYFISNTGKVRNIKTGRELTQTLDKGYLEINLQNNGKRKKFRVHRLVAQAFLSNPDSLDTVDHVNGIKTDNRAENLQWLSRSENSKRFHKEQKTEEQRERYILARKKATEVCKIPIVCIETGKIYESTRQAGRELNIEHGNITKVLKGEYKHAKGYHFEYLLK